MVKGSAEIPPDAEILVAKAVAKTWNIRCQRRRPYVCIASCSSSQPTAPVPASWASRQSSCAPSSRRGGRELCSFCWCSVSLCAPCPSAAAAARPPCAPPPRCRESCFTSRCFSLSSMRVAEEHGACPSARGGSPSVGALQSPPSLPDIAPHPRPAPNQGARCQGDVPRVAPRLEGARWQAVRCWRVRLSRTSILWVGPGFPAGKAWETGWCGAAPAGACSLWLCAVALTSVRSLPRHLGSALWRYVAALKL